MNKIVIALLASVFFSTTVAAQTTAATAADILKEATQLAAGKNKNVLILFTASWCGWCHKMDKGLADPSCKNLFDENYVIRHIVVDETKNNKYLETPGGGEMKKEFNGEGLGIPFWLVFDKNGKLLADSKLRKEGEGPEKGVNTGCPATEEEVAHFIFVLKNTSRMNDAQLEIVRKRFRRNE
jgi:thioredoxin-related protein